jgi:hypothetical protein
MVEISVGGFFYDEHHQKIRLRRHVRPELLKYIKTRYIASCPLLERSTSSTITPCSLLMSNSFQLVSSIQTITLRAQSPIMEKHQGLQLFPQQLSAKCSWMSSSYPLRSQKGKKINFVHIPCSVTSTRISLHASQSKRSPKLASMDSSKKSRGEIMIATNTSGSTHWTFKPCSGGFWSSTHRVTGIVGPKGYKEVFEWRYKKWGAVKSVGNFGWELVRLDGGRKGDVVAVLGMSTWSLTKRFTFAFVGNGLDGMGPEFEAVAVMTGIWIENHFTASRAA